MYKPWLPGVLRRCMTQTSKSEKVCGLICPKSKARGISIHKLSMTETEGRMCAIHLAAMVHTIYRLTENKTVLESLCDQITIRQMPLTAKFKVPFTFTIESRLDDVVFYSPKAFLKL